MAEREILTEVLARVEGEGAMEVRVRDGQIVEGWNNFDFLSMYQQLGMTLN